MRFFCLSLLIAFFACQPTVDKKLAGIEFQIEEFKKEFIKDNRTALFNVKVEKTKNGKYQLSGETIFPKLKSSLLAKLHTSDPIIDSITVLPHSNLNGKNFGLVNLSVCNIRSKPKHSAELATQSILGTPVRVYKKAGDFFYIQTPDNYLGWVDDGGIQLMDSIEYKQWMLSDRGVCIYDYSFVYEAPDLNSNKVTDLVAGNIFQIINSKNNFYEIKLPDGRTGFAKQEKIIPYDEWMESHQPLAENVIATAKEMIGRPYLWGGTSGKGLDCSGFTKTAFYLNGIQLERDASLQVHTGQKIDTDTTLKNLIPGDLLFFGKYREDGSERITHVAIYLGNGKIIHAADRVQIQSLKRGDPDFVEYRLKSFMQARRVIGSEGKNGIIALKDSPFY
ncbi:MAG: NlpC/P60 family protein [Bacteroidota bacterium]